MRARDNSVGVVFPVETGVGLGVWDAAGVRLPLARRCAADRAPIAGQCAVAWGRSSPVFTRLCAVLACLIVAIFALSSPRRPSFPFRCPTSGIVPTLGCACST